ncbi:MAG: V-type ATP synthase subunit I [Chloroflexota bacterium]|jgi:V/A-type H+-transporting ATPase subunit I
MMTPIPMVRVELLALDRDLDNLSMSIGRMALLHPVDVVELGDWAENLSWPEIDRLANEYSSVERRLDRAASFLRFEGAVATGETTVAPEEILSRARAFLEQVEPEIYALESAIHSIQSQRVRLDRVRQLVKLLAELNVDISNLRNLNYLHLVVGMVPTGNLARLDESLEDIPHSLLPGRSVDGRSLLLAFSQSRDAPVLDRALQSAYVERLEIPVELTGTPGQAMEQLRLQDIELSDQLDDLERQRRHLRETSSQELGSVIEQVRTNSRVVDFWRKAGATARTRLLAGWVPKSSYRQFASDVDAVSGGRAILVASDVLPADDNEGLRVPTALRNHRIFRPFQMITETYGLPSYWDVDPTVLAGILFVLFFGAMFGDLGQGFVLLLLGFALAGEHLIRGQKDFGRILAACGAASMIFGVLYGEVFGSENIIPALWFRPLADPLLIIGIAIGLGVIVLSVGLMLGVVTAWRRRDWAAFFFGQNGLVGLWLYWGLLAIVLVFALASQMLSWWLFLLLIVAPASLIILHGPILRMIGWSNNVEDGGYAIQASVETFDLMVRFVSNTVSFLRIGAFALGHVGLGLTIFALAELVRALLGGYLVVIVLGNVLIIALETLIVGIQALRLEYYELFTKFLKGRGLAYNPFSLATPASGSGLSERED